MLKYKFGHIGNTGNIGHIGNILKRNMIKIGNSSKYRFGHIGNTSNIGKTGHTGQTSNTAIKSKFQIPF